MLTKLRRVEAIGKRGWQETRKVAQTALALLKASRGALWDPSQDYAFLVLSTIIGCGLLLKQAAPPKEQFAYFGLDALPTLVARGLAALLLVALLSGARSHKRFALAYRPWVLALGVSAGIYRAIAGALFRTGAYHADARHIGLWPNTRELGWSVVMFATIWLASLITMRQVPRQAAIIVATNQLVRVSLAIFVFTQALNLAWEPYNKFLRFEWFWFSEVGSASPAQIAAFAQWESLVRCWIAALWCLLERTCSATRSGVAVPRLASANEATQR
ncbi:MAG: hypothetical protein EOO73_29360 [Myxococcales bacterium]|nr:MAG: hypothetical protein EOO73_29360 [Myxococcales bacterium]